MNLMISCFPTVRSRQDQQLAPHNTSPPPIHPPTHSKPDALHWARFLQSRLPISRGHCPAPTHSIPAQFPSCYPSKGIESAGRCDSPALTKSPPQAELGGHRPSESQSCSAWTPGWLPDSRQLPQPPPGRASPTAPCEPHSPGWKPPARLHVTAANNLYQVLPRH